MNRKKSPVRKTFEKHLKSWELLAKRMWERYVSAQPAEERSHYRKWDDLVDEETKRGFRAVARMMLRRVRRLENQMPRGPG